MSLKGKVAFVTGATRGVGKCIATALARQGCDIIVAAKSVDDDSRIPGTIHSAAKELSELGVKAHPVQLDVRDDAAVERAVGEALQAAGRIDILVNNAGALHWKNMVDSPMKKFDLVMGVNARGAYACTLHVLPHMIRQNYGHVLMMSPPVDPQAAGAKIAYAISKFGMTLIAQGLGTEVRHHNVAANALWPATMIESYATINWQLGDRKTWRKPDILADAALRIFAREPASFSGHALIDEDFLREEGVTDFMQYRADPDHEPPRVGFDFKVEAGGAAPGAAS